MIGPVRRPSLLDLRPDAEGAASSPVSAARRSPVMTACSRAVIRVLPRKASRVIGAHEICGEAWRRAACSPRRRRTPAMADIGRGVEVARAAGLGGCRSGLRGAAGAGAGGRGDRGHRRDAVARRRRCGATGIGGVLVKMVKPGQDKRADLPTIGPDTVRHAAAAGLRGLAFEARATILADREACLAAADAAGLFLLGLDPADLILRGESMSRFCTPCCASATCSAASISTPRVSA